MGRNLDPQKPEEWDEATRAHISGEAPSTVIPAPFVQIPLGITEDRLVGSVDVAALSSGSAVFQPGLLADAHRGVLYVDELNLLDDGIVNLMLAAVGGETELSAKVSTSATPADPADRHLQPGERPRSPAGSLCHRALGQPAGEHRAARGNPAVISHGQCSRSFAEKWSEETDALATQLLLARQWLPDVQISGEQIEYLVTEAIRGVSKAIVPALRRAGCQGPCRPQRPRSGGSDDLQVAVALVIAPRASQMPPPDQQMEPPPPQDQEPPPPPRTKATSSRRILRHRRRDPAKENDPPEDNSDDDNTDDEGDGEEDQSPPAVPEEFMLDPEAIGVDPDLLLFNAAKAKSGNSGSRSVVLSDSRGRYVKPMLPRGPVRGSWTPPCGQRRRTKRFAANRNQAVL